MKISIISCGEGHTTVDIMNLMEAIHEHCMSLRSPHPVIVAKLDEEPLKFNMTDERKEWVRQATSGATNMSFAEWRVEYQRTDSIRKASRALIDYRLPGTEQQAQEAFEALNTLIGGADEEAEYTFYRYATDVYAFNTGRRDKFVEMPNYYDWTKIMHATEHDRPASSATSPDEWVAEYSISNQHPDYSYPQYQQMISARRGSIGTLPGYNDWVQQRLNSENAQ